MVGLLLALLTKCVQCCFSNPCKSSKSRRRYYDDDDDGCAAWLWCCCGRKADDDDDKEKGKCCSDKNHAVNVVVNMPPSPTYSASLLPPHQMHQPITALPFVPPQQPITCEKEKKEVSSSYSELASALKNKVVSDAEERGRAVTQLMDSTIVKLGEILDPRATSPGGDVKTAPAAAPVVVIKESGKGEEETKDQGGALEKAKDGEKEAGPPSFEQVEEKEKKKKAEGEKKIKV